MKKLVLRQPVYDLYWYFAAERQAIFERRAAGRPAPWTDDPILATYKFCNVFRASDRVSQYLIKDIAYAEPTASPADVLFQVLAFRFFSRPETWESVTAYLGHQPLIKDLTNGRLEQAITHARETNGKLYTGAFILCANQAYGFSEKHLNHLALFRKMFVEDKLADNLLQAKSLEAIFDLLRAYPLMGDFMAYQVAIDLNYTSFINFDEDDFTKAGPGAMRGIKKVFQSMGNCSAEQIIRLMV